MQWSFDRGLISYVDQQEKASKQALIEALAEYYRQTSSWQGLSDDPRAFHHLIRESDTRNPPDRRGRIQDHRSQYDRRPPPNRSQRDRHPPDEITDRQEEAHHRLLCWTLTKPQF